MALTSAEKQHLINFANALIDQQNAQVIIEPQGHRYGYWFGGGNIVADSDGNLYLVGRYRNFGDSRTGLGMGERGLELAIFKSADQGRSFEKIVSRPKASLNVGERSVLSIEGAALHFSKRGVELFISTEKRGIGYPDEIANYLKPGSGVWTIDYLRANTVEGLASAALQTLIACRDPRWLHVKDPSVYIRPNNDLLLGFVTHPFNWSSSNTAYAVRPQGTDQFEPPVYDFFPRGFAWDVAICRATSWLHVPQLGAFANHPPLALLFYDGGESLRDLDAHKSAVTRPRGYSCEELGGLAVAAGDGTTQIERLSTNFPMFVSPHGTGTSRYVDVLETADGFYATWQQSQPDQSQPLVMNFLSRADAIKLLS